MSNLSVKEINDNNFIDSEKGLQNRFEIEFSTDEKEGTITLEGKGSIKISAAV